MLSYHTMIHQFEIHQTREDVYARTADMNMSISEPNVRALEIHQTWKSAETLTTEMKHSISEWRRLHPHFVHRFWDDDACDLFMRTRYPELYATFADLPFGVQKADMFRVAVLHDRGGIYADTDVVPNVVIDESPLWPRADLLFASWELNQTNAFIVSKTPGHPLLLKALLCMQDRHARCRRWGLYHPMFTWLKTPVILYTTGPGAIRSSVGRRAGVYYIPQFEWMPCGKCVEYTDACPENSGRYFSHTNGKTWNGAVDAWYKKVYCHRGRYVLWLMICFVSYMWLRSARSRARLDARLETVHAGRRPAGLQTAARGRPMREPGGPPPKAASTS